MTSSNNEPFTDALVASVWPKGPNQRKSTQPTPLELLQAQADGLGDYTGRIVVGEIVTFNPSNSTTVRHTFFARVPAMSDYTYPLFHVHYRLGRGTTAPEYYPVTLIPAGVQKEIACGSAAILKQELTKLLGSDPVLAVIDQLMELGRKASAGGRR